MVVRLEGSINSTSEANFPPDNAAVVSSIERSANIVVQPSMESMSLCEDKTTGPLVAPQLELWANEQNDQQKRSKL